MRQFSLDPEVITLTGGTVVRTAPGIAEEITGDSVIVEVAGQTHVLNSSAALIWLSLDGEATVASITGQLHEETGVAMETLDHDVRSALARFVASGLAIISP